MLSIEEAFEIASRYPIVKRDRVAELEAICADLNARYPDFWWSVDQSNFDVPDADAEFVIMFWLNVGPIDAITPCDRDPGNQV